MRNHDEKSAIIITMTVTTVAMRAKGHPDKVVAECSLLCGKMTQSTVMIGS